MPQLTLVVPRRHALRSVGLMLLSMFCFAVVDALAKVVALKYPANEVTFFRMAFGVLPAFLLCLRGRPLAQRWRQLDVRGQSIRALTLLGSSALFFAGLPYVPLSEAISIAYSEALLVIVLAPLLLGERLLPRNALAALLGFLGVLMVVKPDNAEASLVGPALLVASAFFGALSMIQIRRIRATDDSTTTVLYFTVVGTLVTGATLPFSWRAPSLPDLGLMLALGLLATLGQLLFTIAVRRAHAATLAPYTYTSIIWASLLGYLIWGEVLSLLSLLGILLIVGSAVVVAVLEQPPEGSGLTAFSRPGRGGQARPAYACARVSVSAARTRGCSSSPGFCSCQSRSSRRMAGVQKFCRCCCTPRTASSRSGSLAKYWPIWLAILIRFSMLIDGPRLFRFARLGRGGVP